MIVEHAGLVARAALAAPAAAGGEAVSKAERDGYQSKLHWLRAYRAKTGAPLKAAMAAYDSDETLRTHPAPSETGASLGVKVKALEWAKGRGWPVSAKTPFQHDYKIWAGKDVWFGSEWLNDRHASSYEEAKEWAQADYETRIRAALEGRSDG